VSYEYSAASGRLEVGNPYRIENLALFAAGAAALLVGIVLLILHRTALGKGDATGIKAILVGLGTLAVGIAVVAAALAQLRYFFGRGRPHNLFSPDDTQAALRAQWLKDNLRQNALVYREPKGAIDGLVHHVFDTLIFAPEQIRRAAEAQCSNLLLTLAILLGMLSGLLFYPDPSVRSWIAVMFLVVLTKKLVQPFAKQQNTYNKAPTSIWLVVLIIVLPILGPPLLAQIAPALPDISRFQVPRTLLISLVILLIAQALFFLALMRQLRPRPHINMACEQRSLSMNGNPAKLFEELERTLQTRWTETIPNRRYDIRKPQDVLTGQSGTFEGAILEETQPVPEGPAPESIAELATAESTLPITALTGLALETFVAAVIMAVRLAVAPIDAASLGATAFLTIVLLLVAQYCRSSAHLLWGRIDFRSLLLWIEMNGSFEEAQLNIGNQFSTAMSSSKKVINIESMTLRVWAAELDSVILTKDGMRDLIGMRGRPDVAQFYAEHLENFARNLSTVIAPSSTADADRIARISQAQQKLGTPAQSLPQPAFAPSVLSAAREPAPEAHRACTNPACGRELSRDAVFCSFCGTRAAG
jgi:hypothetical protein